MKLAGPHPPFVNRFSHKVSFFVKQWLQSKSGKIEAVFSHVLHGLVTTDKFMLLQKVSGLLDSLTYLTGIP